MKNALSLGQTPSETAPCEVSANLVIFQRRVDSKNTPIGAIFRAEDHAEGALVILQLGLGFWSHFAPPGSIQDREGLNSAHAVLSLFVLAPSRSYSPTLQALTSRCPFYCYTLLSTGGPFPTQYCVPRYTLATTLYVFRYLHDHSSIH